MYFKPDSIGTYNIRQGFINRGSIFSSELGTDLDEPTYLTFKLNFYSDEEQTDLMSLDSLPQAMFGIPEAKFLEGSDADIRKRIAEYSFPASRMSADRRYDPLTFLLNHNEDFRAFLYVKFIKGWTELQEQFQFYFQSITGLDSLLQVDPRRGTKVAKDASITVECLEAIDQRVKYLLSLYKTIAWDEEYQRWILPDIYRFFKLDIFISEIRTFHRSIFAESTDFARLISSGAQELVNWGLNYVEKGLDRLTNRGLKANATVDAFTLNVLNGIAPVTCIHCEQCEFDMGQSYYEGGYNINNDQREKTSFKVKIGKAEVIHNWTLIDRVFGNLVTASERDVRSMKSSTGWRDYLKVPSGQMTQENFNGTSRMADADLSRTSTDMIVDGWIGNTITSTAEGVKKIAQTGITANSALDFAADMFDTVRNAINQERTNNAPGSRATTVEGDYKIREVDISGGIPQQKLDKVVSLIAAEAKDVADERARQALELLKNTGAEVRELNDELYGILKDAISAIQGDSFAESAAEQYRNDRSWATDLDGGPKQLEEMGIEGLTPMDRKLEADRHDGPSFDLSNPGMQGTDDRSWATDLDGGEDVKEIRMSGNTPKDQDLGQLEPKDVNMKFSGVSIDGIKPDIPLSSPDLQWTDDWSWATDDENISVEGGMRGVAPGGDLSNPGMQGTDDRSWATDLDGGAETIEPGEESGEGEDYILPELTDPGMQETDDRSWATDLDGISVPEMASPSDEGLGLEISDPGIQDANDRSWATDLDGIDVPGMPSPSGEVLELSLENPGPQSTDDRSWATDLDGIDVPEMASPQGGENAFTIKDPGMQNIGDRSLATDLDGQPRAGMADLQPRDLDLEMSAASMQDIGDRSLATDLDGLKSEGPMSKILDNDLELSLNSAAMQTENDRSIATDLDGQDVVEMTAPRFDPYSFSISAAPITGNDGTARISQQRMLSREGSAIRPAEFISTAVDKPASDDNKIYGKDGKLIDDRRSGTVIGYISEGTTVIGKVDGKPVDELTVGEILDRYNEIRARRISNADIIDNYSSPKPDLGKSRIKDTTDGRKRIGKEAAKFRKGKAVKEEIAPSGVKPTKDKKRKTIL